MDVFDLVAKIRLDKSEYEKGIGEARGSFSGFATGLKNGMATVVKIGGAAVAAGAAGVTALTKMGVAGYAQYEQLAGGAQLLWGDAYAYIAEQAKNAYATVQMSQNDYLQQVNGFSTGLKTHMKGNAQAAAELAHNIVVAQADVVAATGASQEAVQNAFNGIMKSNFTMLDNLQLGITPTKEGFQQLIDQVNAWNAANGKATNYQISNLADCQAALVDYIAMQGLSGYAANEAAGTIQGSLAMVKSAWSNLVVGMADDNADLTVLIDNLVTSISAAKDNIVPRIEQTVVGIGRLFEGLAPMLASTVPSMIENTLPALLAAAVTMVTTVVGSLPGLIDSTLPIVVDAAITVIMAFLNTVIDNLGLFLQTGIDAIIRLVDGISAALPDIIAACFTVLLTIVDTLTSPDGIKMLIGTAVILVKEIAFGIVNALPKLVEAAIALIENLVEFILVPENMDKLLDMAVVLIITLMNGLVDAIPRLFEACVTIIGSIISFLLSDGNIVKLVGAALSIILAIAGGLIGSLQELSKAALEMVGELAGTLTDNDWGKVASDVIDSLLSGLKSAWGSVTSWFGGVWDALFNRSINVGSDGNGRIWTNSHATGLNYVPYDEYQATLHRGEAVLTAAEARVWRNGGSLNNDMQSGKVVALLEAILDATANGNAETVKAIYADKTFSVDKREFARVVRAYA